MRSRDNNQFIKFIDGDQNALSVYFERYHTPLCLFTKKLLGESAYVQDVVLETFEKAWEHREKFKSELHIKAFLYQVARNNCLNRLKAAKRASRGLTELNVAYQNETEEQVLDSYDTAIAEGEILQEIYRQITLLPQKQKEIVELSFLSGKRNEEIAQIMGISINTVKVQKMNALKKIRKELGNIRPEWRVIAWIIFSHFDA